MTGFVRTFTLGQAVLGVPAYHNGRLLRRTIARATPGCANGPQRQKWERLNPPTGYIPHNRSASLSWW
jgi:hypothetical protein